MKITSKKLKFPLLKRFSEKRSFYHFYIPPRTRILKIMFFLCSDHTHSQANHCVTIKSIAFGQFATMSMRRLIGRKTSLDNWLNAELMAGGTEQTKTDWNSRPVGRSRTELATSTSGRDCRQANRSVWTVPHRSGSQRRDA